MKKLLITLLTFLSAVSVAQKSNDFVFMFDNSGSMAVYYQDPKSLFNLFSKALMKNSIKPDDKAKVLLFTKSDKARGIVSPRTIFEGTGSTFSSEQVIQKFSITLGTDRMTGATDLIEALNKGIEAIDGPNGIIWIVTDNINDNSGTGDSSYSNTLEFYNRLRSDQKIRKILLYPIPEKVAEGADTAKGYVAYGIVYSENPLTQQDLEYYDGIIRGAGIRQKAITLKPLDIGTVVLKPKVTQSKISEGKLYYDGNKLRGFGFEEGEKVQETFNDLSLKSNLYPYIIRSARLNVGLENFTSSDYSVKSLGTQSISPSSVSNVSPEGEVTGFSVIFNLPEITPRFSFNTIFKEDFTIGGDLVLDVSQVDIVLDQGYVNNFKELFALQSVPEIFQPVLKDKKIITKIPLEIKMKYGPWRLFVLIGLIAAALAVIGLFVYLILKKKCFELLIDNQSQSDICLGGLSSYTVSHGYTGDLGRIKKSLFGGLTFEYSKNTTSPGKSMKLTEEVPFEVEFQENEFKTSSVTIMIRPTEHKTQKVHTTDESGIY
ncbi:MAG: hypothetical protein K1X85_03710 [Ignavibacteria bacterium]|nr:hypothetical protein [Ignavibacteria bacterium]